MDCPGFAPNLHSAKTCQRSVPKRALGNFKDLFLRDLKIGHWCNNEPKSNEVQHITRSVPMPGGRPMGFARGVQGQVNHHHVDATLWTDIRDRLLQPAIVTEAQDGRIPNDGQNS